MSNQSQGFLDHGPKPFSYQNKKKKRVLKNQSDIYCNQVLYVSPRYQVSVHRTNDPLVCKLISVGEERADFSAFFYL